MALIEIDGLPNFKMVDRIPWRTDHGFHSYVSHNQMVRNIAGIIQQKGDTLCSYHIRIHDEVSNKSPRQGLFSDKEVQRYVICKIILW